MIGDINLFLSDVEEDSNDGNKGRTSSDRDHYALYSTNRMIRQAEVNVMIAMSSHCKCNLGVKIAFTVMHYTLSHLRYGASQCGPLNNALNPTLGLKNLFVAFILRYIPLHTLGVNHFY